MATANRRTVYRPSANNAYRRTNQMYVQGNTARKLQAVPSQYERTTIKKDNRAVQKNRDKALHMNVGYVLFLVAAMMMAGLMLTWYLTLQSDITNSIKNVARLESELNSLKLDNDERYSRINSDINLEEVRRVAIQELGMQYAQEGQIYNYDNEGNDYMRKITEGAN